LELFEFWTLFDWKSQFPGEGSLPFKKFLELPKLDFPVPLREKGQGLEGLREVKSKITGLPPERKNSQSFYFLSSNFPEGVPKWSIQFQNRGHHPIFRELGGVLLKKGYQLLPAKIPVGTTSLF
jgi:hypothetical protein